MWQMKQALLQESSNTYSKTSASNPEITVRESEHETKDQSFTSGKQQHHSHRVRANHPSPPNPPHRQKKEKEKERKINGKKHINS